MPLPALLIVLTAAVCHAGWNVLAHGAGRTGLPFLFWSSVTSSVLWIGIVPVTGGLGAALPAFAGGVLVSSAMHIAYLVVLQRGYATGDLSTVYATARGSGPIISVVLAVVLLGERPQPIALAGVALVVLGVLAIGTVGGGARRLDPGVAWGLLTGVAIAAYTIWDANAVRAWSLQPVAYMVGTTVVETVVFGAALTPRRRELLPVLRAQWWRLVAFGVLSPASYILVLTAVRIAPVALVAPLRETSVVLVSVFGAVVLHEGRPARRIAAAAVVVTGIALIAI